MSDFNSSLPIRTEAAGDVISKICDASTTSQQLKVNADGSIDVNSTISATDLDIRDLSATQDNVAISDGTNTLAVNADGSINTVISDGGNTITVDGSVTVSASDLDIRDLSAASDSVSAHLKDEAGNAFTESNPLPVTIVDSEGAEINDYNTQSSLAANGTNNHDYTVSTGTVFKLSQVWGSASGKLKLEVQIETGVGTGVFNTKFVAFNSTANSNIEIPIRESITVAAGVKIRVIRTNRDNQAQDVYSTISGHEI